MSTYSCLVIVALLTENTASSYDDNIIWNYWTLKYHFIIHTQLILPFSYISITHFFSTKKFKHCSLTATIWPRSKDAKKREKRLFCSRTREGVKGASPIARAETRQNWRQNMMYVTNQNEKNSTVYKAGITKYKICHECSPWRLLQPGHLYDFLIRKLSLALLMRWVVSKPEGWLIGHFCCHLNNSATANCWCSCG